jgi:hypothetical protein
MSLLWSTSLLLAVAVVGLLAVALAGSAREPDYLLPQELITPLPLVQAAQEMLLLQTPQQMAVTLRLALLLPLAVVTVQDKMEEVILAALVVAVGQMPGQHHRDRLEILLAPLHLKAITAAVV